MKRLLILPVVLCIPLLVYSQKKDNTLNPEEFASGWELLFDGETLKGWKSYNGDTPQTWMVDDHSIHCDGTDDGDDIMTVEMFGDFDLKRIWFVCKIITYE